MEIYNVQPKTIARACGGWIAVSPPQARFLIAKTGETEPDAIKSFAEAYQRWTSILDSEEISYTKVNK